MALLSLGSFAPNFTLPVQEGVKHTLRKYQGQWVVLYFYPKDDTPGCTTEACDFRDNMRSLTRLGAVVFGVSVDAVKSHAKFVGKYDLNFALLADEAKEVVNMYGVWGQKKFMGKTYTGITRVTYIINPEGRIAEVYDKVKATGHAEIVLKDLKSLAKEYEAEN